MSTVERSTSTSGKIYKTNNLKVGGNNNAAGTIAVLDAYGNTKVELNTNGITLSDGTSIIGTSGVLSIISTNTGIWQELGRVYDSIYGSPWRRYIKFSIYIPNNFVVTSAIVKFYHAPYYVSPSWGYARNIKLYKSNNINTFYRAGLPASEYADTDITTWTEISSAFGASGFTGTPPSSFPPTGNTVETVTSIDISSSLTVDKYTYFKIDSSDGDASSSDGYTKQGLGMATLTVTGYKK